MLNHLKKTRSNVMNVKTMTRIAAVAAIYIVFTVIISPLSYGEYQFRFAEILVLLCFYRKDYSYGLIIGCLIANIFSPLGIVDMVFGTLATTISVYLISRSKNIYLASLYPVIFNGIIVGLILFYIGEVPIPLYLLMFYVAAGEFIVVSIIGVVLFKQLEKNEGFLNLIEANQNIPSEN